MLARRLVLGSAVVAALSVLLLVVVWVATSRPGAPPDRGAGPREPRPPEVVALLAAWDERRAGAWAHGDVDALAALYVEGSRTGRRDLRMLEAWVRRGLTVQGLRTQVLRARVRRSAADAVLVAVTDRSVGGVAVGAGRRTPLPVDRPSTRVVALRRVGDAWLVEEVRERGLNPGPRR